MNFRASCAFSSVAGMNDFQPTKPGLTLLVLDKAGILKTCGGVEYEAGLAPAILDEWQTPINVICRLGMEGNVQGTGIYEVVNCCIDWTDHEMDIDGGITP